MIQNLNTLGAKVGVWDIQNLNSMDSEVGVWDSNMKAFDFI